MLEIVEYMQRVDEAMFSCVSTMLTERFSEHAIPSFLNVTQTAAVTVSMWSFHLFEHLIIGQFSHIWFKALKSLFR